MESFATWRPFLHWYVAFSHCSFWCLLYTLPCIVCQHGSFSLSQAQTDTLDIEFSVTATDNGSPQTMNSSILVMLTVFSPDNHFNPQLDRPSYTASLDENTSSGTLVLNFSVTDDDPVQQAAEIGNLFLVGGDSIYFEAVITGPQTGSLITV